jgi:ABC-2 type transport system ATP-binding protein
VTSTDQTPLVADEVGRRYRRSAPWALRGVSLSIAPGSITALVGPNGAGKSTLIRAWMGFERPDEGRVLVEGTDPRRDRVRAVEGIGYVPQAASLYRDLTVDDHFAMARVARPTFDAPHARGRLATLGIAAGRRVGDLSGGEQAQVALSIALGTRAPILLLDEPLASLDPLARREFLALLVEDVRSTGATALLSSHIVTDVEQACDWLVVLSGGRLAFHAMVAEARATHRSVPAAIAEASTRVADFIGPAGDRQALVRSTDPTLAEASLDDIVLGYLAAGRPVVAVEAA